MKFDLMENIGLLPFLELIINQGRNLFLMSPIPISAVANTLIRASVISFEDFLPLFLAAPVVFFRDFG